ncbi:MAG: DUF512 domain-containing protein [Lachnospiraceae bacterium]|jgi:putative radical SAM enzyme (TIGR03279 family)|nr:DUF512 domain-containing protein [Lachnospiraceae bacterium]
MAGHEIKEVVPGSIAEQMEIASGDLLLSVNGQELEDIFDYHFLTNDTDVTLLIQKPDGDEWELDIEKDPDEDIGIIFRDALLDKYRSCSNKCVFCFIDQMPPGMRPTLYFKDDDARLSFLQGNYVTLTNMSDDDIERIIHFHMEPINVSIHTTNPELRKKMLHNRFAGDALKKLDTLYEAGITMNAQIVLCKGINDGAELERTIKDLSKYVPVMQSLSIVPMGMTKYRQDLPQVPKFDRDDAISFLKDIEKWQKYFKDIYGTRFIHASDEWYIMAGVEIPDSEYYEGFEQLENGVGMVRLFLDEFRARMEELDRSGPEISGKAFYHAGSNDDAGEAPYYTCVTGTLFAPYLIRCMDAFQQKTGIRVVVKPIINDFFGHDITVTGLITASDIINQLKGRETGRALLIPETMLRRNENVFLDDLTTDDLADKLHAKVLVVGSSGGGIIDTILDDLDQ